MPHFTIPIAPNGPLLQAVIGVSQSRQLALQQAGQPIPQPQTIFALVDTGASCTCMDPSVIQALQLTATGNVSVNTPSTGAQPHTANQYDVSVMIPGPTANHPTFIFPVLPVVEAHLLLPQGFHALIGRDVLQHCLLVYNGPINVFTLAY